jgi:phosphopantetheine adenylyltransferase
MAKGINIKLGCITYLNIERSLQLFLKVLIAITKLNSKRNMFKGINKELGSITYLHTQRNLLDCF